MRKLLQYIKKEKKKKVKTKCNNDDDNKILTNAEKTTTQDNELEAFKIDNHSPTTTVRF